MILTVDVYRENDAARGISRLRACVVQEIATSEGGTREVRGSDLLVRRYTHVDSALRKCRDVLSATYKLVSAPEIRFRVSEDAAPEPKPRAPKKQVTAAAAELPLHNPPPATEEDPWSELPQ